MVVRDDRKPSCLPSMTESNRGNHARVDEIAAGVSALKII